MAAASLSNVAKLKPLRTLPPWPPMKEPPAREPAAALSHVAFAAEQGEIESTWIRGACRWSRRDVGASA